MTKLDKNSVLEKRFIKYLKNDEIKIVSFDIFETLVFRDVAKPIDIFKKVGKSNLAKRYFCSPLSFQNYRISAEKNARLNKNDSQEVTLKEIYSYLPISKKIKDKFYKLEVEEEIKNIYINKQIYKWIKLAKHYNKKVFLISDMYLSKEDINKIVIEKLKDKELIDEVYISSEQKVTKYTSALFTKIRTKIGFSFSQQLHIGDNFRSDYLVPKNLGINTILYNLDKNYLESLNLEYKYMQNRLPKNNNIRILSALQNPYKKKEESLYFNLGAMIYGPMLWEFNNWLDNVCKKNKITQICFLMREGRVFKKFFDKVNRNKIDTKLIYASRASTYISSLNFEEFLEKGINFYKFRLYKVEDFYKKFKLEIKSEVVKEHKTLMCSQAEKKIINNKNILTYMSEDFFSQRDIVKKTIENEKKIVIDYIKSLGIKKNSMIVDFGGGGSIIKNITSLDKNLFKISALFYMHSFGYEVLNSIRQLSFLNFDKSSEKYIELIRRSPEFTENLFNGKTQSTNSYKIKKNKIKPVFSQKNVIKTKITKSFDKGIKSYFKMVKKYKKRELFTNYELLLFLSRLIEIPTENEVKYLGDLDFEVGAGSSGCFKLLDMEIEANDLKDYYISYLNNINTDRDKIPWINGLITKKSASLIRNIKGFEEFSSKGSGIDQIVKYLKELNKKEIIIYGAGAFFETLYPNLEVFDFKIPFLIDVRANNGEYEFYNMKVKTLENSEIQDNTTILIASGAFLKQISKNIENYAINKNISLCIVSILGIKQVGK